MHDIWLTSGFQSHLRSLYDLWHHWGLPPAVNAHNPTKYMHCIGHVTASIQTMLNSSFHEIWRTSARFYYYIPDNFLPRLWSLSTLGGYFVQLLVLWGHMFCPLSRDRRLSVSRRSKIYYFSGKVNWAHVVYPLLEVVCISKSLLWQVPLYSHLLYVHVTTFAVLLYIQCNSEVKE